MQQKVSNGKQKVLVIGLDSVPPELLFDELIEYLPNIKKMMNGGLFGKLESCHPPITVPAWMVMMSSKTPGKLGVYGFKHRKGYSYTEGWLANSQSFREDKIWDILGRDNKKVCLVGVPPSYPVFPVNGNLVSCFVTPKGSKEFTYPPELSSEILEVAGGNYMFDVKFRTENRDQILEELYQMTEKRFMVVEHLLSKSKWDFFMFVEIGVDRLHHMFWKYYDKTHPRYQPNNRFESVIPDYYKFIDEKIGRLLERIDDDTWVILVSDHGTAGMKGAFCINEWLIKEGYLVLKEYPSDVRDLDKCHIDWEKTKAWGWGGYYARVFLNVKNREQSGTIPLEDVDRVKDELSRKISLIAGPDGKVFDNKVFSPKELYDECNGSKPDLMVYFDNLYWRSAGTVGHKALYLSENDTGPDDSVHWMNGVFMIYNKKKEKSKWAERRVEGLTIYDVAPTILEIMGSKVPKEMRGKPSKEVLTWTKGS